MLHPILRRWLTYRVPPAPFTGCVYKSTQTTTTDETTTTWTGVDIGAPHPDRIVVLGIFLGIDAAMTVTVNGYAECLQRRQNSFAMSYHRIPTGTTATIVVSATGSARKAVSVFVAYPGNPVPLDVGADTRTGTTNATIANLKTQVGGCLIYEGGQLAVSTGNFTTTWVSGTDAVTEDIDTTFESASCYTAGHINLTVSESAATLNMGESVSGSKQLVAMSFGPPRPSAPLKVG
jgi:hypothetical protein